MMQTVEILMEDKPGVLMRALGIVTAKGCNIASIIAAPDQARPGVTRVTLQAEIEERLHPRVVNELNRLVQVLAARDVTAW